MPETPTQAEPWPVISDNPHVQKFYEQRREEGVHHNMAVIFATGRTPGIKTSTTFMANRGHPFNGNDKIAKRYADKARAAGVNPNGKFYSMGLARFPGDPQAWISDDGDVRRICKQNGWACEGSVNCDYKPHDAGPGPGERPYRVADDLVDSEVQERLAETGERPSAAKLAAMKEQVREEITPAI